MQLNDQVIVVTGGGRGIGAALCRRFAQESPRGVVVADIDYSRAQEVATSVDGLAVACDVSSESQVTELVATTEATYGPIGLFCANAGIVIPGGLEVSDTQWQQIFQVNTMAHVYSARAVVPGMLERGGGYLLHTASAAGLLTEISSAPYAVTKHAAVAFAEWLALTYGDRGLKVSCLCPQGVHTEMIAGDDPTSKMLRQGALAPTVVADMVVEAIERETFLVLPHPEVHKYFQRKAADYDRWLGGMRRLRAQVLSPMK